MAARGACEAARTWCYQAIDLRVKDSPQSRAVALARVAIVRAERAGGRSWCSNSTREKGRGRTRSATPS